MRQRTILAQFKQDCYLKKSRSIAGDAKCWQARQRAYKFLLEATGDVGVQRHVRLIKGILDNAERNATAPKGYSEKGEQ